jgi:hypothetical protein
LYTSPTYEDFHALLIQPDTENTVSKDEEMHRFSPIICRGVCDGGQIVWANTHISQGLTGRTELPLNTAVGVPICSIGHELYILVLFAVEIISMTPQVIEYLATVSRTVTENSPTFLSPAFSQATAITQANTEDFVGVWDIGELVRKYQSEVEFHLLPIGKLQKYFDCNEILLFCDFFTDFKTKRDGRFTVKQLEGLRDSYKARKRSESFSSVNSKNWDINIGLITNPNNPNSSSSGRAMFSPGIYTIDNVHEGELGMSLDEHDHLHLNNHLRGPGGPSKQDSGRTTDESQSQSSILHICAQMTYKYGQCRFHEFMISVLGMTVFESSELWLVSEKANELYLVAGVYRNPNMQKWISFNENLRLPFASSGPGRIITTGSSQWDTNYASVIDDTDPRKAAAIEHNINTSFGIPLIGLRGICGALMFYTTKKDFATEPLLILLVERAVHLIATSNVESATFAVHGESEQPSTTLSRWLMEDSQVPIPENILQQYNQLNQEQLLNNPFSAVDYQQKLEMCRSIVNTNKDVELPYPPGQEEEEATEMLLKGGFENVNNSNLPFPFATSNPVEAAAAFQNTISVPTEPVDQEVSAAFALANIGKVHWKNFLNGSNNGANLNGYNSGMKLESNKLVGAIYDEQQQQPQQQSQGGFGVVNQSASSSSLPKCKVDDCNQPVENQTSSYCINHRNMRRCQKEGCNKCAQGATKYCIAHGGGRRCTFPGCFKGARDKFFCAAHGGGKRCTIDGCSKSAVGGSNLCTAHGGGKRCQFPGCAKSSQAGTKFCVRHGGGRSCVYPGCNKVSVLCCFFLSWSLVLFSSF